MAPLRDVTGQKASFVPIKLILISARRCEPEVTSEAESPSPPQPEIKQAEEASAKDTSCRVGGT